MINVVGLLAIISSFGSYVAAESHKITFTNNCGHGTPKLKRNGAVLSTGEEYDANGIFDAAIAFLDNGANGPCEDNGENCGMVELTLKNDAVSGVDITLIPSHKFSDPIGFEFTGACSGAGAFCAEADCKTAYFVSNDDCVVVGCQATDLGLNIIFCGGQSTHFTDPNHAGSPCNGNSASSAAGSTGGSTDTSSTSTNLGLSAGSGSPGSSGTTSSGNPTSSNPAAATT